MRKYISVRGPSFAFVLLILTAFVAIGSSYVAYGADDALVFFDSTVVDGATDFYAPRYEPLDRPSERGEKTIDERDPVVLVVAPPVFSEPLMRWIEYRQGQGYKILLLTLARTSEDGSIDQGIQLEPIATPVEIREKIRKASLQYRIDAILLVGDGAPTRNAAYGWRDVVPAPRVNARVVQVFGSEELLASDGYYADIDGDEIPDAPIGRLPVETPEELEICIDKIIQYEEDSPAGNWTRRISIVAGPNGLDLRAIGSAPGEVPTGPNPLHGVSTLVTLIVDNFVRKLFSDFLPQEFIVTLTQFSPQSVFCPYPEDFGAATLERFNEGALFWVYLGHGLVFGLDRYLAPSGRNYGVFEIDDCEGFDCQGRAPIALFFACHTGAYDASWRCLAEEVMLHENGPIASVGASRLTAPYGMCRFGAAMLESAFLYDFDAGEPNEKRKTLGGLYFEAQRRTLEEEADDEEDEDSFEEELDFDELEIDEDDVQDDNSDPLGPGSQLKWINERLRRSLEEAEEIKRKNASFIKTIDRAAAVLDPTASRLHDQLLDHIAEFNLFGDPLLRVKFPTRIRIDAPDIAYSSEDVVVSGELPFDPSGGEAIIQGELLLADFRSDVARPTRAKIFTESEEAREEFNATYKKANDFVVDAVRVRTRDGKFRIRIMIPADFSGESVVRIAATQGENYIIGSKRILIRPKTTTLTRFGE